ncbi:MAG TPA: T9SS type A sorting domain-containing protein [Ignavibacteria bacterium]|nr:T9SS type A sorting domain-containing protein [Ignavibacteria bacterium]HMR00741.1 T9SS type A sorting domain-containing protein [Ignavibacteria bacterium]
MGTNTYYDSLSGRIFICGGANQSAVPNDTCWWYNISTGVYQQAALLPEGRWSGKLVRVKSNLYLVGSINSTFSSPDGKIFRYSLQQNSWSVADTMPVPLVHEAAVTVINDSLIAIVGGSTNGFQGAINRVRLYEPVLGVWKNSDPFPVNNSTAHAELNINGNDTSIFVFGGYNAGYLNTVYKGIISTVNQDTTSITWQLFCNVPFSSPVYRVAGTKWRDYMLMGPAMNGGTSLNNIWGLAFDGSFGYWTNFLPSSGDSAAIISTFSTVSGTDSNYFYLFGGFKNPNVLNAAQKYSFITPPPIGIVNISNSIPSGFKLHQNFPNPFNPLTKIRFDFERTPGAGDVLLKVFDISGRSVSEYRFQDLQSGLYEITFDGSQLASGVYFYTISDFHNSQTKKMILIK